MNSNSAYHDARPGARTRRFPRQHEVYWDDMEWRGVGEAARHSVWRRGFAAGLGVAQSALVSLGVGYDPGRGCAVIPMRDADGTCGIQRRFTDGTKRAILGSRLGYFGMPLNELREVRSHATCLLVTEGASDCMAAFTLGFLAIGRAGCKPGDRADAGALAACAGMHLVVVQDPDQVGRAGARAFATHAMRFARSVRLIEPPAPFEDLRAWVRQGGLTRAQIEDAIAAMPPLRVQIEGVAHGG